MNHGTYIITDRENRDHLLIIDRTGEFGLMTKIDIVDYSNPVITIELQRCKCCVGMNIAWNFVPIDNEFTEAYIMHRVTGKILFVAA